jgi:formate-dependent nitrite reductase membrane component NrfD
MDTEASFTAQAGPIWDWRVAMDLFLGGAGVGALLFVVLLDIVFHGKYRRICQTGAWMSPFLVLLGLAFLLSKLGRPMHLPLTYLHFNPSSPLWWGGVFQPIFLIGAFFYARKWNKAEENKKDMSRMYLGGLMGVLALIVGAYHGLLLGVVTARPLWSAGPTVVSAIFAFISTGTAAVMLVHLIRMKVGGRLNEEEPSKRFFRDMALGRAVMLSALLIQLGTFFLWWLSLKTGPLQAREALAAANEEFGTIFWAMGISVGVIIPLALIAFAFLREGKVLVKRQVPLLFATCVMILIGGYYFRLSVVLGGQVPLPMASLN